MLTSLFVLIRIFSNPFSNVFQKKLTNNSSDPLFIILITHGLLTLVCLPFLFFQPLRNLSAAFWLNIIISVLLAIAGNTLIVAALKSTDLSILGPINAYKSVVSVILGIFMLSEFPTLAGLAGILLIISGSYFIMENDPAQSSQNRLAQFFQNKGILLRFAALIFSATEAIFLKKALLLSSPLLTFLFWSVLGLPAAGLAAFFVLKSRLRDQMSKIRPGQNHFLLLALTTGLMQLSTLLTFGALQVGYSLALFQTSTLLSVLFGYHFFQEKNVLRRLLGAVIMVLGAALIIIFGSPA
jgi:drug/metabolite transporter (DMT)-like permease